MTLFWRNVLSHDEKRRLVANIAGHLKDASEFIQQRAVRNFTQVDPEYGGGIARLLQEYKRKVCISSKNSSMVTCFGVHVVTALTLKLPYTLE